MNEVFLALPQEKQQRIINAALEVFSKNDYKKASTDDIASKANISKGSLFYYFKNKKTLYLYLFEYVYQLFRDFVLDNHFHEITDFFELIYYAAKKKMQIIDKNPYLLDFMLNSFLSNKEDISEDIQQILAKATATTYNDFFKYVDFNKFKEDINPEEIYNILMLAADGYIYKKRQLNIKLNVEELMKECKNWLTMFKKLAYKEEYQNEDN
ncbi:MAG: TetR/AcrR family transcriptional regulator [Coprobacillaceae bacterium]